MSEIQSSDKPRVLAVHDDVGTLRLIREALGNFAICDVDTSPTAEYAFELGLQRDYALFLIGLKLPVLHGELLYELLRLNVDVVSPFRRFWGSDDASHRHLLPAHISRCLVSSIYTFYLRFIFFCLSKRRVSG